MSLEDAMDVDEKANHGIHLASNSVRYSNSPRRGVTIEQPQSPTKSVHPEHSGMVGHMESIDSQADLGKRTIDLFDYDSDGEEGLPRALTMDTFDTRPRSRSISPAKRKEMPPSGQSFASKCEPKRVSMKALEPDSEGYERMDSNLDQYIDHGSASHDESYTGSVDEFPEDSRMPKPSVRLSATNRFRTSGLGWTPSGPSPAHQKMYESARGSSMYSEKIDQRLGVHQMAYEMLIQGMMSDQELMDNKRATFKDGRSAMLPPTLPTDDPRSPRDQLPANPSPERTNSHRSVQSRKKAHFIPSPIDVGGPNHYSLPADIVRTPYPYSPESIQPNRKDFHRSPPPIPESPAVSPSTDLLLTLSIRRSNPNSPSRVTTLTIPHSNDYSTLRTNEKGQSVGHTLSHHYDDQELFRHLHLSYKHLSGPFIRLFSARSLTRIAINGPATRAADAGYGWLLSPRSPKLLASRGLTDSFSEEKILHLYRHPREGKNRFAFVHWARRLAAAPSSSTAPSSPAAADTLLPRKPADHPEQDGDTRGMGDVSRKFPHDSLIVRGEQPEGLEFVVSWSARRISIALLLVILLAILANLLWVFLGKQTTPGGGGGGGGGWPDVFGGPATAGFKGAGDRVGTGVLVGVLVLLIGLTAFGGWLGISWLVL